MICGGGRGWGMGYRAHSEWTCSELQITGGMIIWIWIPAARLLPPRTSSPHHFCCWFFVSFLGFLFLSHFFPPGAVVVVQTFRIQWAPSFSCKLLVQLRAARVGQFVCLSDFKASTTKETSLFAISRITFGCRWTLILCSSSWLKNKWKGYRSKGLCIQTAVERSATPPENLWSQLPYSKWHLFYCPLFPLFFPA